MSFNQNYAAPPNYTYNRGMTQYPEQQYANNVAYYTPQPRQQGGGRIVNRDGSPGAAAQQGGGGGFGLDFGQFFQNTLGGGGGGGGQAAFDPRQLAGRDKLDYRRMMAQGASPFRQRGPGGYGYPNGAPVWNQSGGGGAGGGGGYGGVPPAGINPQTPVGGGGGGAGGGQDIASMLAQVNSGITNGRLSDSAIAAGMANFRTPTNYTAPQGVGGQTYSGNDGSYFAQLMQQMMPRAANDFQRTAAQQQAGMDLDFQTGRSGANLGLAALLQAVNRENVTNDVAQRNALINNLAALLGGL